jgi:hypothetical protein
MDSSVLSEDEIWFLRVFHHISDAVYIGAVAVTGIVGVCG